MRIQELFFIIIGNSTMYISISVFTGLYITARHATEMQATSKSSRNADAEQVKGRILNKYCFLILNIIFTLIDEH